MRLIDADEARKIMCHKCNENFPNDPCEPSDCIFVNAIKNTPTAYDVEAVVRELEELAKLHARHQLKCEEKGMDYCADRHEHKVQALDEAIAIVKRGGRNDL